MKIVLGSSSPRRKELLSNFFTPLSILQPAVDEIPQSHETPIEFVTRAAIDKMQNILTNINDPEFLLITCDTIVTIDSMILGKPIDYEHAYAMISQLSGRTHQVISAISLYCKNEHRHISKHEYEISNVTFKKLSDEDIKGYLSKIHYLDKAGSYAAQEYGRMIIESIDGSLTNVIGFPLRLFFRMLLEMGIFNKLFC